MKKKYQVHLPQTDFPMKASLAMREPMRLKHWDETGLAGRLKSLSESREKKFVLHDGPPYANGQIHIGHSLNKVLKDMILKFRSMSGLGVRYVPGWDCHGLPIEHALLKEKGLSKNDVQQIKFRKMARAYAGKYVAIQKADFIRLGIFGEWDAPYLTMNPDYQTEIARSFLELYEKGFVYRGEKPVYWSIGCETALAEAELEYQDKISKAIFVHFPTEFSLPEASHKKASFLIWTTTPWTLPANVGVAIHPDLNYGLYSTGDALWIFACDLESKLREKLNVADLKLEKTFTGKELQAKIPEYQHPFLPRKGKVILADYVSNTDGTGMVHIAPGHGEDDYIWGHIHNQLPIVSPVDHKGCFTAEAGSVIPLEGKNVFAANDDIIAYLKENHLLQGIEDHAHSYPFCWRSKTPVIVRSTPQWFLKVDHENLRTKIISAIQSEEQTRWIPDWGKKRILSMIESRPDWCLSRQRLWGVPIPVAYDKETGKVFADAPFQKRVIELFSADGADAWFQRPWTDFFPGREELAAKLVPETDILDVWFDSGVSHQAVLERGHALGFPADLYLEGSDQHRGWFQTSLITSLALSGQAPFKTVLTHGFVVDGEGKKMSKSQGNVISPQEVFQKYGADILRLWVSSVDTDKDIRMSGEILERMSEAYRKIRNTFRYLLGNLKGFDPSEDLVPFEEMQSLDRWVLSRLHLVSKDILEGYENYRFHKIYQIIYEFCVMDLSSFYLDSQKDLLYCDPANTAQRNSARTALFIVAKTLCQFLAPIMPFTADEIYLSFPFGREQSVHESTLDRALWQEIDQNALDKWTVIRDLRRLTDVLIEEKRAQKLIGSSLDCSVEIHTEDQALVAFLKENQKEILHGLIISEFIIQEELTGSAVTLEWNTGETLQNSKLTLRIESTSLQKCGRCWRHTAETGELSDPELCSRCLHAESLMPKESL